MSLLYAPEESRREVMGEEGTLICPRALKNESLRFSCLILSLLIRCLFISHSHILYDFCHAVIVVYIATDVQTVLYLLLSASLLFYISLCFSQLILYPLLSSHPCFTYSCLCCSRFFLEPLCLTFFFSYLLSRGFRSFYWCFIKLK